MADCLAVRSRICPAFRVRVKSAGGGELFPFVARRSWAPVWMRGKGAQSVIHEQPTGRNSGSSTKATWFVGCVESGPENPRALKIPRTADVKATEPRLHQY
jgi:hypothetical protein